MKTITIRDLRHRWPEAEKALKLENEILITRDSKPVAKLISLSSPVKARPRWNMEKHARMQKKASGGKLTDSLPALTLSRENRSFK